jgi:hypothetical protein
MDIRRRQLSGSKEGIEGSTEEEGRFEGKMEEGEISDGRGHYHHHHRDIMHIGEEDEEEKEKGRKMDGDEMMETDSPEGQEDKYERGKGIAHRLVFLFTLLPAFYPKLSPIKNQRGISSSSFINKI